MSKISNDQIGALQTAEHIVVRIDDTTCDRHQRVCSTLTILCSGKLGREHWSRPMMSRTCLERSQAVLIGGQLLLTYAGKLRDMENRAAMLESQASLF